MKKLFIIAGVVITFAFGDVSATIINVPADYDTIQVAINASADGDTVLVADGHYYERINFYGKGILLTSEFMLDDDTIHIQNTIIDADTSVLGVADTGSVVCFVNSEDSTSVIKGFTIQNGIGIIDNYNNRWGGGIYCFINSSPTISNNTIIGNSANYYGGGIGCSQSSPTINNNTISENSASSGGGIYCGYNSSPTIGNNTISGNSANQYGGGILCIESSSTISNNTISGNSAVYDGGGIFCIASSPTISNNTISGNSADHGGGISCWNSSPTISNNTISGNSAVYNGGGICCDDSYPVVVNTILWANIADSGSNEIYLSSTSSISITYSDIQDTLWPGEGNISVDPLFGDADFHLQDSIDCGDIYYSPCIDTGDPDISDSLLDCEHGLGTILSDMGAYGGDNTGWTGIEDNNDDDLFIPKEFMLSQNYPNPFNATTTISFAIEYPQLVTLKIYNLLGREVQTLINEQRQAGMHTVRFDASRLSSGIYFYRLQAGEYSESKRMVLLK